MGLHNEIKSRLIFENKNILYTYEKKPPKFKEVFPYLSIIKYCETCINLVAIAWLVAKVRAVARVCCRCSGCVGYL